MTSRVFKRQYDELSSIFAVFKKRKTQKELTATCWFNIIHYIYSHVSIHVLMNVKMFVLFQAFQHSRMSRTKTLHRACSHLLFCVFLQGPLIVGPTFPKEWCGSSMGMGVQLLEVPGISLWFAKIWGQNLALRPTHDQFFGSSMGETPSACKGCSWHGQKSPGVAECVI